MVGNCLPYAAGYVVVEYGLVGLWWDLLLGTILGSVTVTLMWVMARKDPRQLLGFGVVLDEEIRRIVNDQTYK